MKKAPETLNPWASEVVTENHYSRPTTASHPTSASFRCLVGTAGMVPYGQSILRCRVQGSGLRA